MPNRVDDAVVPVSKRFFPADPKLTKGDRCSKAELTPAQGYYDEQPVRGTIELLKKQITIKLETLKGAHVSYRVTLDQDACGQETEGLPLTGQIVSPSAKPAHLGLSLVRQTYFETDRGRLKLEGTEADSSVSTLELWETPRERLELRNTYQRALQTSDDVEVVVKTSNGSLLLALLELGSRQLSLVQLGGSPLKPLNVVGTDVSCEYHQCNARLDAFELSAELTLIVATVFGQNCGAKCTEQAAGELWTLGPGGFHRGHALPSGFETPAGLNYDGSSSKTTVSWADTDGVPPLELLVESSESPEEPAVAAFDPQTGSYTQWTTLNHVSEETLAPLRGGTVASF